MQTVKRAFDHCADDYACYRPPYPPGVFARLDSEVGPHAKRRAADIGAGTGIFSRGLSVRGWDVVAVEPSRAMLERLHAPSAQNARGRIFRLCASAEQTALADASVSLVTAAQAFHWFNPPYSLAEFARILIPGGLLALTWNNRDATRSPFVEAYENLISRYNPAYQREYREQDWPAKIRATGLFEAARYHRFDQLWRLPAEDFVGFSRSVSYIRNVLAREQQPRFENELRALLRQHFGQRECEIPLRTDLWTARRRQMTDSPAITEPIRPSRGRSWLWTALLVPFLVLPYRWLWLPCGLAATLLVFSARVQWREVLKRDHTLIIGSTVVLILRTGLDPGWWLPWIGVLAAIWLTRGRMPRSGYGLLILPLVWLASAGLLIRPPMWRLTLFEHSTPRREAVLVCAGDSLTAGVDPTCDSETYVGRLRERLGCTVINAGAVNDRTGDLLARLDKDVLKHRPNAVLLFIGGNDYLNDTPRRQFVEELERVAARIAESGAKLVIVEVPSGIVWNPYAGIYRHVARRHGAVLVPESRLRWSLSVEFVARSWLRDPFTSDGIHLSASGARQVAEWLEPAVLRALRPQLEIQGANTPAAVSPTGSR
jgi:lysophospholipase L1-like esterase/SAM-dependent methyltransferase